MSGVPGRDLTQAAGNDAGQTRRFGQAAQARSGILPHGALERPATTELLRSMRLLTQVLTRQADHGRPGAVTENVTASSWTSPGDCGQASDCSEYIWSDVLRS